MSPKAKIDVFKSHKAEYVMPSKPVLIDCGPARYLVIEGQGEPGGAEFQEKISALYGIAFTIKMTRKFAGKEDYTVSKLEAIWWADGVEGDFSRVPMAKWRWKLAIRTPEFIRKDDVTRALKTLVERGKGAGAEAVRLETLKEGRCVQMLHVGPYEKENETMAKMHAFAEAQGFVPHGRHHEIYISDPRRVPPARLRTILRHPVRAK